jgi:hypothetical protein
MTEDEAILHYLRTFAGQRCEFCKMLNVLAANITGHVKGKFPARRDVKREAWMRLRNAATRLRDSGVVIMHRTEQVNRRKRRYTIRINEAFAKNSVL